MKLPDDVFRTPAECDFYRDSPRVVLFMRETGPLSRNLLIACLLKQIDNGNDEIARLKRLGELGKSASA